jgi:hypothetical protein
MTSSELVVLNNKVIARNSGVSSSQDMVRFGENNNQEDEKVPIMESSEHRTRESNLLGSNSSAAGSNQTFPSKLARC